MSGQDTQPARIAFLLDNLSGGGAQRVMLNLASGFASAGYVADLLVCKMRGELTDRIPSNVNVVQLGTTASWRGAVAASLIDPGCVPPVLALLARAGKVPGTFRSLAAISKYLKARRPQALLSALPKSNINAVLAGWSYRGITRIGLGVHVNYSARGLMDKRENAILDNYWSTMMRRYYPRADVVIAVSRDAAIDVREYLGLPRERVTSVYNPIATPEVNVLCEAVPDHPWFVRDSVPVILGMGRFAEQKNFSLLLEAFARVRQRRDVRLVLLGGNAASDKPRGVREALLAQARRLGVEADFDMPGFVGNPFAYLKRAGVFVLSSDHEGFGNVLVEALLCGCQVVSTNCPSGPAEILDNGRYGELVPVGDASRLADAICRTLDQPKDREVLRSRGREFSVERAVENYRRILLDTGPAMASSNTAR
jgi:glycosyltransferase involved in cell wall biosynthesis